MKTQFCFAALAVVLVVSTGVSSADIPKTINFQGRLSTAEGIPLNGLHDIKIAIHGSTKPLFVEEHPGVAVSGGVFNILIGSRTVGGVPSDVFEYSETSIGITVGADAEMTPRLPLAAVPYAYRAEMAQVFEVPLSVTTAKTSTLLTLNNTSSGNAVLGISTGGKGIYGMSTNDYGVYATSSNGPGAIYGQAAKTGAFAIKGAATSSSGSTIGVMGEAMNSPSGIGVVGNGGNRGVQGYGNVGVFGQGADRGVHGFSQAGHGVYGQTDSEGFGFYGGYFIGNSPWGGGVYGESTQGAGVVGIHTSGSIISPAVIGNNTGAGDGVLGETNHVISAGVRGRHSGSGPGGQFSSAFGPAILAEGEVRVGKIKYNTPRERYYSLGAVDFTPGKNEDFVNNYDIPGASIMHTGSGVLAAGVHLPHGATVTAFSVTYYDGVVGNMNIRLRCGMNTMAVIETMGTPGYGTTTTSSITFPVVDNVTHAYNVRVYSDNWPGHQGLRIIQALITYTIAEAE